MDPLGVVLAVLALGVYPGGLYLLVSAALAAAISGVPHGTRPPARSDVIAVAAAIGAAALMPLPGTPAAVLPPPSGASPNAVVLGVLAALAVAAPGLRSTRWRTLGLVAVAAAALGLAAAAGTLSMLSIDGLPGAGLLAARALVASALFAVAPLAGDGREAAPRLVRAVPSTMLVLLGASLLVPPGLEGPGLALAASGVTALVMVHAVLARSLTPLLSRRRHALAAAATVFSAAAIAVAAVAPR